MSFVFLDGKLVKSEEINPAKHKFIGTFRPPNVPSTQGTTYQGELVNAGVVLCRCGDSLWTTQALHDHYLKGHFDTPQYVSIKDGG